MQEVEVGLAHVNDHDNTLDMDDRGIDDDQVGDEDAMMDVLMGEALKAMEKNDAKAELLGEAVHHRPEWERGSSILVERQGPLDAHQRRANQSLRFIENADGERVVATIQRPGQMEPQSVRNWELALFGGAETADSLPLGDPRTGQEILSRGELKTPSAVRQQIASHRQQVNQRKIERKAQIIRQQREMDVFLDTIDEEIDEAIPTGTKKKYQPIQDDFEVRLFLLFPPFFFGME